MKEKKPCKACSGCVENFCECPCHLPVKPTGECEHFGIKIDGTCGKCGVYVVPPDKENPWRDSVCEKCGGCNLSCSFNMGADCVCRDCGGNEMKKEIFLIRQAERKEIVENFADLIKHKFNGYGGKIGFTQNELLDTIKLLVE